MHSSELPPPRVISFRKAIRSSRPLRASKSKRSSKPRRPSKPPMADEMLDIILDASIRALSKEVLPPLQFKMARTLGTLTASKLLFRLHNDGADTFFGPPIVWEHIEQVSDQLAVANAYRLGTPDTKVVPGLRQLGPGTFLSLVRTRTTFRWCPVTVNLDGPPPVGPELVMGALPFASKVWWAIYESVGRRRVLRPSYEDRMNTYISELAAAGAAAKLFLALWGNGEAAAFLEWLAEEGSEEQYRLHHENGEKSRRRARNESQSGPAATPSSREDVT
jgi:hypothetical protein